MKSVFLLFGILASSNAYAGGAPENLLTTDESMMSFSEELWGSGSHNHTIAVSKKIPNSPQYKKGEEITSDYIDSLNNPAEGYPNPLTLSYPESGKGQGIIFYGQISGQHNESPASRRQLFPTPTFTAE